MRKLTGPALVLSLILTVSVAGAKTAAAACDQGSELEREKCRSKIYLEKMAKEKDAKVAAEGVVVRPTFHNPRGERPKKSDAVTVGYYLTDREGKLIETTMTDDEVANFPLDKLIECWQIAVPTMTTGSHYKVSCPSDTAYGDKGAGEDIKGGAAITFRITLFGIGQDGFFRPAKPKSKAGTKARSRARRR